MNIMEQSPCLHFGDYSTIFTLPPIRYISLSSLASAVTMKAPDSFLFRLHWEKPLHILRDSCPHSICCCLCRYGPVFSYGRNVVCVNAPNNADKYTISLNGVLLNAMRKTLSEMEVFGFNKK